MLEDLNSKTRGRGHALEHVSSLGISDGMVAFRVQVDL